MNEDQIERAVERKIDAIDKRYMRGDLSTSAYEAEIKAVDKWAALELRDLQRRRAFLKISAGRKESRT